MLRILHKLRCGFVKMAIREAINSAMVQEIERHFHVFLIEEEVRQYQGAYKFCGKSRIQYTPITEAEFTRLSFGASMQYLHRYELKLIVEFTTFNFAMQVIGHIINSAALHQISWDLKTSMVFRGIIGAVAVQHKQCFAAWYNQNTGLIVLFPYNCDDARGFLKASFRDHQRTRTVVFRENEIVYNVAFEVPDNVMDKE